MKRIFIVVLCLLFCFVAVPAGSDPGPSDSSAGYSLDFLRGHPLGHAEGIQFRFEDEERGTVLEEGTLIYGLVPSSDGCAGPGMVYAREIPIRGGKALIRIGELTSGDHGTINYRVVDARGRILGQSRVAFIGTGPYFTDTTIVHGPFLCRPEPDRVTIAFETDPATTGQVTVAGRVHYDFDHYWTDRHEIEITGLKPDTSYEYTVTIANGREPVAGRFKTPPKHGTRQPFVVAFTAGSKSALGGGEYDVNGINAYMLRRVLALASAKDAVFFQFMGDMGRGNSDRPDMLKSMLATWRDITRPWSGNVPVYAAMGGGESQTGEGSAEKVFSDIFQHPENGPDSEDFSPRDPDREQSNFPSYAENVYYYLYDNVAVVVLNSMYWVTGSSRDGNTPGYLMYNQLAWLRDTLWSLKKNDKVDYVFIALNGPVFPNGGRIDEGMWHGGSNEPRPIIDGEPYKKGIIENRDDFWRILMDHPKIAAVLTGGEANYSRIYIKDGVDIYGPGEKADQGIEPLEIERELWQINCGGSGSPLEGAGDTPWRGRVETILTTNAVVFFHVKGTDLKMEVINPDTLCRIE